MNHRRFLVVLAGGSALGFAVAAGLLFGIAYAADVRPVHTWPLWFGAAVYGCLRGLAAAGADIEARRANSELRLWRAIVAGGGWVFGKPRGRA